MTDAMRIQAPPGIAVDEWAHRLQDLGVIALRPRREVGDTLVPLWVYALVEVAWMGTVDVLECEHLLGPEEVPRPVVAKLGRQVVRALDAAFRRGARDAEYVQRIDAVFRLGGVAAVKTFVTEGDHG